MPLTQKHVQIYKRQISSKDYEKESCLRPCDKSPHNASAWWRLFLPQQMLIIGHPLLRGSSSNPLWSPLATFVSKHRQSLVSRICLLQGVVKTRQTVLHLSVVVGSCIEKRQGRSGFFVRHVLVGWSGYQGPVTQSTSKRKHMWSWGKGRRGLNRVRNYQRSRMDETTGRRNIVTLPGVCWKISTVHKSLNVMNGFWKKKYFKA